MILKPSLLDMAIFRDVLFAIVAVLVLICALDFIFAFLDIMSFIGSELTFADALLTVVMQLPAQFIEFAPAASLIGTIVILGLMASQGELVVIRAAGLSPYRISLPALLAGLVISCISVAMVEFVIPKTGTYEIVKGEIRARPLWLRDSDYFIQVGHVVNQHKLQDVTLFHMKDQRLSKVEQARSAEYAGGQWHLFQVHWTEILLDETGGLSTRAGFNPAQMWQPQAQPKDFQFLGTPVESLALSELNQFIAYRQSQGLDVRRYQLRFWQSVLAPVSHIIMTLLASSLVFGSMRLASMSYRVTIGLMYGLGFYYAQELVSFIALVYTIHPLFVLILPLVLFGLLGRIKDS